DEVRLAAGQPMLVYPKRPAPGQEPRLAAMIDAIRAAGSVSYRTFATPRELERLLADDLAVLLSEHFAGGGAQVELPAGTVTFLLAGIEGVARPLGNVAGGLGGGRGRANPLRGGGARGRGGGVGAARAGGGGL